MEIKNCIFQNTTKYFFHDGSEESSKFIEEKFFDFEYCKTNLFVFEKDKDKMGLIYHGSDAVGEYHNIVPNNVYIVEYRVRNREIDWFTPEEFENIFLKVE